MQEEINKTILLQYEDACDMMEITKMSCGCCNDEEFVAWYEKNEAYIFKSGMFIVEGLMIDDNRKLLKLAFSFAMNEMNEPSFTIYNYYNQKPVCHFIYSRQENDSDDKSGDYGPYEPKILIQRYDRKLMDSLGGDYGNEELGEKIENTWKEFERKANRITKEKLRHNLYKEYEVRVRKMEHEFMCSHIVKMFYASMYYFSLKRPDKVDNQEYEREQAKENQDVEITFKTVKKKYYYTGYINLNHTKIYRVNRKELKEKREFQRHVEKWDVRGHYRTVNGKKIWIEAHVKGKGRLENRVYGVQDESEVNVRAKVFEVTTQVPVVNTEQTTLEKYKEEFDRSFSKVTPEEFVEQMEEKGYEFEPVNPPIVAPEKQKSWLARIVERIINLFKK